MIVYDIESWPNAFIVSFKEDDEVHTFVVSPYRDDRAAFFRYTETVVGKELFGFNSWHYDSPLLWYTMSLKGKTVEEFCLLAKNRSDELIIADKAPTKNWPWTDIDGFKYWSKMLRKSKRISLKSLGIQMGYPVVMELPYPPYKFLTKEELEKAIEYNSVHDINLTALLMKNLEEDIKLRRDAKKRYHFNALSWDGVKLGFNILLKIYSERTGRSIKELQGLEGMPNKSHLAKKIILPQIQFREGSMFMEVLKMKNKNVTSVKSPYALLKLLSGMRIGGGKTFKVRMSWKGILMDIGSGGLHSVDDRRKIVPRRGERLVDIDFSSYYPHLIWKYGFCSRNFPGMAEMAGDLITERIQSKKTDPAKAALLKLALNGGLFGTMNDKYRPSFDPLNFFSVTINGQLILVKLAETIIDFCEVQSINTDGITVRIPENSMDLLKQIVAKFEEEWKIPLEFDYYDMIARDNVNNYIAIRSNDSPELKKGKAKKKGWYQTKPPLGDSCNYLVIPKAVEAYYLHGTQIEEFIYNHENKYDFCGSAKVDRSYTVRWGAETLPQRLNRYYPSTTGKFLYKDRRGKGNRVPKVPACRIYNDGSKPMIDLDYNWFIREAKKMIYFEPNIFENEDISYQVFPRLF
jgi:hypothetical protein